LGESLSIQKLIEASTPTKYLLEKAAKALGNTTRSTEGGYLTETRQRLRNSTEEHLEKRSPEKPSVAVQRQGGKTLPRAVLMITWLREK